MRNSEFDRIMPNGVFRLFLAGMPLTLLLGGCASSGTANSPSASAEASVAALPPTTESPTPTRTPQPTVVPTLPERITPDAEFRAERPTPEPDPKFEVPKVQRFKLANGLPVILASDDKLPLVFVQLVVRTGSLADPVGKAGLADLAADMLDEGTKTRSALEISGAIEQLGASLSTGADWDYSAVSVSGLTEVMDRALPVWADVLLNPAFSEGELERVRENRMAALKRRKDSPPALAAVAFGQAVYGDQHPLGWPQDGTEATLPKLSAAELRAFHEAQFKPENATLVVAGNMTEAQVKAVIGPLLGTWKGGAKKPRPVPAVKEPEKTKVFLVDKASAPQSSLRVGLPALPRKHPDYYKARVMNEILGGSFRRLSLNLREQKGWTYGVYSRFATHKVPGPWVVSGEFVADKTAPAVQEILSEITRIRSEDVPAPELQEAKDALVKAFPASFATMKQLASQMAGLYVYDLPRDEFESYQKKVAAVSVKDVRDMARKYLLPEHLAIVVVGDRASNAESLGKIAPVELRDADGNRVDEGPKAPE